MNRSSTKPPKDHTRVRTLRTTSPTGQVIVVSRRVRRPTPFRKLPPCLRAHRATRLVP